jgi:hypothetical protein
VHWVVFCLTTDTDAIVCSYCSSVRVTIEGSTGLQGGMQVLKPEPALDFQVLPACNIQ